MSDDPGALKLEFIKRDGPSAVVRIDYDAQSYQVNYVSSYMLSHDAGTAGVHSIHPTYNIWIRNLLMRITLPGDLVPASAVSAALAASR